MKRNINKNTINNIIAIHAVIALIALVAWSVSFYKLTQCDFESDYKCEVVHAAGLIPPVSIAAVWFDSD